MSAEFAQLAELSIHQSATQQSINLEVDRARNHQIFSDLNPGGTWADYYNAALELAALRSTRFGICDHGYEHSSNVATNAIYLGRIAQHAAARSDSRLDTNAPWKDILSAPNLVYTALLHDIGYGHPDAHILDRSVPNHAELSAEMISEYYYPIHDHSTDTHKYIYQNYDLFQTALSLNLGDALTQARELDNREGLVQPEELFPVLFKFSDMLDLYRASRVRHLTPEENKDNLYYHLSASVREYGVFLNSDDNVLAHAVTMDETYKISTANGEQDFTFAMWSQYMREGEYGRAQELGNTVSRLIGKDFAVKQVEYDTIKDPRVFVALGSNAIIHT